MSEMVSCSFIIEAKCDYFLRHHHIAHAWIITIHVDWILMRFDKDSTGIVLNSFSISAIVFHTHGVKPNKI